MSPLMEHPPLSAVEPVTEVLHGVTITDPYRWLEDQDSPRTRAWIDEQTSYARVYLDNIPGRERVRDRVRELLDVETCDSFLKCRNSYFFRKRLPGEEQPSIYLREGPEAEDRLLIDPAARGTGILTAVRPHSVSHDGSLLLYEVKQGGERTGTFEILDVRKRETLRDVLPRGYLHGFAFAPDGKGFYYVHEASEGERRFYRAAYHHLLGTRFEEDREIFFAGEDKRFRLVLIPGRRSLGLLLYRLLETVYTDFYLWGMGSTTRPVQVVSNASYRFAPRIVPGRILALIDQNAPNHRIVELQPRKNQNPLYFDLVPEADVPIRQWMLTANYVVVSYVRGQRTEIVAFDRFGQRVGEIPMAEGYTVRLSSSSSDDDAILLERESFTRPIQVLSCDIASGVLSTVARRSTPLDPDDYSSASFCFPSVGGMPVPMSLVGRRRVLAEGTHPTIMTSYGGFGISSTPQFSVLVGFLVERGCLFALPSIRGGSEFGTSWHNAAKRRNRQVAFDDFFSAAEWLTRTGRTSPRMLGIFGGSNSGLLVAAALTQRPELFRAVLCLVPITDMLRYHLFDNAQSWKEEFGTADDREDFPALQSYSPYHAIREGTRYPATMFVSGDADQNCNPMHARKMTARLQAANAAATPVFLDYQSFRGHSPVLPLGIKIRALTDRLAFLCDQLGVAL